MDKKEQAYTDEDRYRAAYALNLCTVSVSQIVDYDDINILEQEYEMILNNLNLENMPKDEALLNILKQILDTVTFFRISESDKSFFEKEYQYRIKNAIWSAASNFNLFIAGGNINTLAVSLAMGIGYMNYRREKAKIKLEKARNKWKLQRTALEQLNGLRRELFDTAWRLADEYNFPDEYRLTEKQIKRYNAVLMDTDVIRRYERLDSFKNKFKAYIPFWYQFGSTAAEAARITDLSEETKKRYKKLAAEHFETFFAKNDKKLLREDQFVSACALEYIDLMDMEKDEEKIRGLLDVAAKNSGEANDVMQLCAMAYLKIKDIKSAKLILRRLVNEDYNTILNAQILSNVYVSNYIYKNEMEEAYSDYEILKTRVASDYLFPFPYDGIYNVDEMERNFYKRQQKLLTARYHIALEQFIKKYTIRYNKLIQTPDLKKNYPDTYFLDGREERERRFSDLEDVMANNKKKIAFCSRLSQSMVIDCFFEIINEMYRAVINAGFAEKEDVLGETLSRGIAANGDYMSRIERIEESELNDITLPMVTEVSFQDIVYEFFKELDVQVTEQVRKCSNMKELAENETKLRNFWISESLRDPDKLYERNYMKKERKQEGDAHYRIFSTRLLGIEREARQNVKQLRERCIQLIEGDKDDLIKKDEKIEILLTGNEGFQRYIDKCDDSIGKWEKYILAIIDDKKMFMDNDLLFTEKGIITIANNSFNGFILYGDVKCKGDSLEGRGYNSDAVVSYILGMPYQFEKHLLLPKRIADKVVKQSNIKYSNKNVKALEVYELIGRLEKARAASVNKWTPQKVSAADEYDFLKIEA